MVSGEKPTKKDINALSAGDQALYREAKRFREKFVSPEGWEAFMMAFLKKKDTALAQFAHSPESFDASRYKLSPLIAEKPEPYDPDQPYEFRTSMATERETKRDIYIDAALAFAILYKRDDGEWETISRIAFVPDLEKNVLLVDQIQGGDAEEIEKGGTKEAKRSRMKFKTQPEEILFDLAKELVVETGMKGIGLRKAKKVLWQGIKKAVLEGKTTLYHKARDREDMRGFANEQYDLLPVSAFEDEE